MLSSVSRDSQWRENLEESALPRRKCISTAADLITQHRPNCITDRYQTANMALQVVKASTWWRRLRTGGQSGGRWQSYTQWTTASLGVRSIYTIACHHGSAWAQIYKQNTQTTDRSQHIPTIPILIIKQHVEKMHSVQKRKKVNPKK